MNQASKAFIGTYTGKKFFLLQTRPKDIDIRDIAHGLALQCRWTGQCKHHYSIAQHSWYCSYLGPDYEALDRLLHDGSEAYMGDMNRPLKHFTQAGVAYREQEAVLQMAIRKKFKVNLMEPPSVHVADNQMLYTERDQLLNLKFREAEKWLPSRETARIKIKKWSPEKAEKMFLQRFNELTKGRK